MASPNLDLVRSIFTAWERWEWRSFEWADPEIEVVVADGASPGRWSGLTGMAQGMRDILSAWEEHRELDDEHVLVLTRYCGRGKKSGLELGQKGAVLVEVRAGKVTRIVRYWDRERALADLDLAPEGGSQR